MNDSLEIPKGKLKYYITSTGKIWWISREEVLSDSAQQRRELIGNSFDTPEDAAFAKVKLEAIMRLSPFAEKELRTVDGCPAIITKFHLDDINENLLQGDIMLLAGVNNYKAKNP